MSTEISQFVSRVVSFTSEYSQTNWQAGNLIGPPSSNLTYGDITTAWCPARSDQNQILELAFDTEVYIKKIRLYENYNGGACTRLEALNPDTNEYEELWSSTPDSVRTCSFYLIFEPEFEIAAFKSNQIRVSLTLEGRDMFSEIEAVEIVGTIMNITLPRSKLALDLGNMFVEAAYSDCEIRIPVLFGL